MEEIKKEVDDANAFSPIFKTAVEALVKEITAYSSTITDITAEVAAVGNVAARAKTSQEKKDAADAAINAGLDLKKKYLKRLTRQKISSSKQNLHKNQPKKAKHKPDASDAITAIQTQLTAIETPSTTIQAGINTARQEYYAADLELDSANAVGKLETDSSQAKTKQGDLSAKAVNYADEYKTKIQAAIDLSAASDEKAMEDLNSLATSVSAACASVAGSGATAEDKVKAVTVKGTADQVVLTLKALLAPPAANNIQDAIARPQRAEKIQSDADKKKAEEDRKEAEHKEKLEEIEKRAQKAEEESRRLTQQIQDAEKKAANEVKLPLDQNGNPINIDHYMDEQYQQPADGDSDVNCLNKLYDCDKPEMRAMCAGTCAREMNNQDHGQNCDSMADLCRNAIYADMMSVYCKGTCR
uniref:ShKT domain-containing protein n=1 Tax=Ditylenchus dipsaci TaxID=166011 RepID=A0A915DBD1_9BILA